MESILTLREEETARILKLEKPYQARIILGFARKGEGDFMKMTSLPLDLRKRLKDEFGSALSSTVEKKSEGEDAMKLLLRFADGSKVECVRLRDGRGRHTACLSSQVGCAMGCRFCRTGLMGLKRSLRSGEIAEEFVALLSLGEEISNIVYMGMGEPLANFTEVAESAAALHDPSSFNVSYRKMTISTCGIVPGIRRLKELGIPVRLAVSLVAANDSLRSSLMPVNDAYPLRELKSELISFQRRTQKRITLEYCMLGGVNVSVNDAEDLASFVRGLGALVNLIPWNPIPELSFRSPTEREQREFKIALARFGVECTVRRSKGQSASAACGQLAAEEE